MAVSGMHVAYFVGSFSSTLVGLDHALVWEKY